MEKKSSIAERYFEKPTRLKTWSGIPVKEVYTPDDVKELDYQTDIGNPGQYPYIRGIFPDMYRGRLWSMRELCSYASPRATNQRLKYLIDEGESAVNVIGDMPTMIGIDSDHPRGRCRGGAYNFIEGYGDNDTRAKFAGHKLHLVLLHNSRLRSVCCRLRETRGRPF